MVAVQAIGFLDRCSASPARAQPEFPSEQIELRIRSGLLIALIRRKPEHPLVPVCIERVMALLEADLEVNQRITAAAALISSSRSAWTAIRRSRSYAIVEPLLANQHVTPMNRVFWLVRVAHNLWLTRDPERAAVVLDDAFALAESQALPRQRAIGAW